MSICAGLIGEQTIWVNDLYISPSLDSLYINATTCGEFSELHAYIGNKYLLDESLDISTLIVNTPELDGSGVATGRNTLTINVPPSSLGLTDLNTVIVIRFVNTNNDGLTESQSTSRAVASFASLYPCMIHNLTHLDSGCHDCKNLNNALMLNLLMDITTAYFQYGRISEGVESYYQMLNLCLENEIIFRANTPGSPTACGQYGGIGCWIVDTTFVVGQPYIA